MKANSRSGNVADIKAQSALEPTGSASGKRKTISMFGDSIESYIHHLVSLREEYLASYPGECALGNNSAFHGSLRELTHADKEKIPTDLGYLEHIHKEMEYRLNETYSATMYLDYIGVARPNGLKCEEIDVDDFLSDKSKYDKSKKGVVAGVLIDNKAHKLFPSPPKYTRNGYSKMWPLDKGFRYLVLAITLAEQVDEAEISGRIKELLESFKTEIEESKNGGKKITMLKTERQ
jgi:hypothetical protein